MATIYPIQNQGIITSPGSIIYAPAISKEGDISNIKITNIVGAATVSLLRYIKATNVTIRLFKFVLATGDVVDDDTLYHIKFGDYLYLESNIANTTYAVSGEEKISPT